MGSLPLSPESDRGRVALVTCGGSTHPAVVHSFYDEQTSGIVLDAVSHVQHTEQRQSFATAIGTAIE